MRNFFLSVCICLAASPALAQPDEPGTKDHPLIPRMAGYYINNGKAEDFNAFEFPTNNDGATERVEGRYWHVDYLLKEGAKKPSPLEILRNHRNALAKIGARQIAGDDNTITLRADKPNALWVHVAVANDGEMYSLDVVQPAAMTQQLELTASELAQQLASSGSVALRNILFDTGKATIKPESAAALATIAEALKADASLKLEIQGHTDNVGNAAANLKLSQDRAAAVRAALVSTHVIAAGRLTSTGFGDTKPVGDNRTEDGRAQNRRVELVKK